MLTTPHFDPLGGGFDSWKFVTLALCMMAGTASLPHILMRYFTTPSVRSARKSVGWSLFFIFLLYFTAPALATLTKLQLLDPALPTAIVGKSIEEVSNLAWVQNWGQVGMVAVADQNGDGILQLNEFFMLDDAIVLATPEIAGLPYVISGLVAAGGMAAAMSTADGLLLAIANALSHDLYYKIVDPKADTRLRLLVARVILVIIGIVAALIASLKLTGILGAVAWAFCFACSGLFWPLVFGVWWKRANGRGDRRHDRGLRRRVVVSLHGERLGQGYRRGVSADGALARPRQPALRHRRHGGEPRRHGGCHARDPGAQRRDAGDGGRDPRPTGATIIQAH